MLLQQNSQTPSFHPQAEWVFNNIAIRARSRDPVWLSDHERQVIRQALGESIDLKDVETGEVFQGTPHTEAAYSSKHEPEDVINLLWRLHDKKIINAVANKFS